MLQDGRIVNRRIKNSKMFLPRTTELNLILLWQQKKPTKLIELNSKDKKVYFPVHSALQTQQAAALWVNEWPAAGLERMNQWTTAT